MTGFGAAADTVEGIGYAVEVRSLNNRYFKASIRMPEDIQGLEPEIDSVLRHKLWRGSVTVSVRMSAPATALVEIDDNALEGYLSHLENVRKRLPDGARSAQIDLTQLLNLPGVLKPALTTDLLDRARPVVLRLVDEACDKVLAMRIQEGRAVADDLLAHREVIRKLADTIRRRAPQVVEEYHTRLRARVDELLARAQLDVNQVDLIREVGLYAERADISEEVSRLGTHLDEFEKLVNGADDQPAGRTLDFLAQEMLREANTIGSKSNDAEISRAIVEVKGSIDRIKEQAQNVE